MISVSRHAVSQVTQLTKRYGVARGVYVPKKEKNAAVTLASVGGELGFAVKPANTLAGQGVKARVVSYSVREAAYATEIAYQCKVLPKGST